MNIHKHPSLEIQECTERFLKRSDFSTLESLLQCCFSKDIAPPKLPLILDEIESRKDSGLNYQLYDFIINRLKKKDASADSSDNIQALTNAANNMIAHIDASRESFLSQPSAVKSVGLASYLSYPYLAQTPIFVSACKNIDAAISATFRQAIAPTSNKILYSTSSLDKIREDIADTLLHLENWNDKQRFVLATITRLTPQELTKKLKHDFSGFDRITYEEMNILRLLDWNKLTNPGTETSIASLISKYVYAALQSTHLTQTGQINFDANSRAVIGLSGTSLDFDWVLSLIQEINWDTCANLDGFASYGNLGKVAIGNFYKTLNEFVKKHPSFLEVRDYQSHLIFKCDLNIADEKPFEESTSSIGYPLSIFESGMHENYFAYATPYRAHISEIGDYNAKRQDIFVSAIEAVTDAGFNNLAVDIFIVGLLGYAPFAEELANVCKHSQDLVTAVSPILQKNVELRPRLFKSISDFVQIITRAGSPISKLEAIELKNLLKTISETFTFEIASNITPLLAPLPFSLPERIESQFDSYSKERLEDIRWQYNQFLGEKNTLRMAEHEDNKRPIFLPKYFYPIFILIEHLAKKYINPHLTSDSILLSKLMERLYSETNLTNEQPYQEMCESTGKNKDFFETKLVHMRNWTMHPDKNTQRFSIGDYEETLSTVLPALIIFFNEISRK